MSRLYPIGPGGYRYDHIAGTGGIGTGIFFSLVSNETLGRNESRAGYLLPYKDYCKQHIILHYIAVLLGRSFSVYPIGKVGHDEQGKWLLQVMQQAGVDTRYVSQSADAATLFSVCFQYPDKSGGNITTDNSASSQLSVADIEYCFLAGEIPAGKEIILAVPEVPLAARIALLRQGRKRKSLNVASFLSAEAVDFIGAGGIQLTDLLSINMDEARNIIGQSPEEENDSMVIEACVEKLLQLNPALSLIITNGSKGVYCFTGGILYEYPALSVPVVSTAGAGDALIAGIICGLCCGLPLAAKNAMAGTSLNTAVELGVLLAAYAVTAADSIHPLVSADALYQFLRDHEQTPGPAFRQLFINELINTKSL
jgi:sugar/nucleoside kinase (ribokinase family)